MGHFTIRDGIMKLADRHDLTEAEAAACMMELMSGTATPAQFGAYVTGLRLKGETVDEITGMARVMLEKASRIDIAGPLLDTCGTGGDESGSFNVSTCAAFIAAGAGARIAKHGNRAMTSRCGSADVLEALGARIDLSAEQVGECIERTGVGFMFAQTFHPAMRFVAPLRREIGIRTVFNILGPLTNPAGATHQVIGVPRAELVEKLARVLGRLGSFHALVVHGTDGFDEISIAQESVVAELVDGGVRTYEVTPEQAGLRRHDISAVIGDTPEHNAAELRAVLDGRPGALRDFALLNAAAALVAWGSAADLKAGVEQATQSVETGAAKAKLEAFVAVTNSF